MRRNFAIMHLPSRLATADVVHLLRLQRPSWMLLHSLLPLIK
jgi:hypothetical protein